MNSHAKKSSGGSELKWLITGGCGFIGTALISKLCRAGGSAIRVVDNLSVGTREDLSQACYFTETAADSTRTSDWTSSAVQLIIGDILDEKLALKACAGADVIVHLAANTGVGPSVENPRRDCLYNVVGTLNYLEGARHAGTARFIFASSGAPVGECTPPIHEEVVPHPVSPYGASKLAGEAYCSAYFRSFGIPTIALRFGNVYGPGSCHKHSVVAKFIKQALAGDALEIFGDGTQTRDFIFVEDLVSAILSASTAGGVGGEVFQIATASETSVAELLELILVVLKSRGISAPSIRHSAPRSGDVRRNFADTTKARKLLDWQARTTLSVGLEKTVDYLTAWQQDWQRTDASR